MRQQPKVLVIVGPTAVGKTALSIELAKRFDGEIISGDSMQVYRGLDIGTAKVTKGEAEGIPHYLIDILEKDQQYSVADFQKMGRAAIEEIHSRGKLPIIVGGTGFYIQALLYDMKLGGDTFSEESGQVREKWTTFFQEKGETALYHELLKVDEAAATTIHPHNVKRVIRALEVYEITGKSITQQQEGQSFSSLYPYKMIGLSTARALLYDRINLRVELMMKWGLLEEASFVKEHPEYQSAQGIGYKEFLPYFQGESSLEESVEKIKQNSRRYAKRQLTWFRNRMTANWWDLVTKPEDLPKLTEEIANWWSGKEER